MKTILVDTSVWVAHFREFNRTLADLLARDAVMMHPMILGEIACGTPPARMQTLSDMAVLQHAQQASLSEAMGFVEREQLYGLGCGIVDMVLLASTLMTANTELWTLDKRLSSLAERFGVAYRPNLH